MGGGKKRGEGGKGNRTRERRELGGSGEREGEETLVFQLIPLPIIPRASQTANV